MPNRISLGFPAAKGRPSDHLPSDDANNLAAAAAAAGVGVGVALAACVASAEAAGREQLMRRSRRWKRMADEALAQREIKSRCGSRK